MRSAATSPVVSASHSTTVSNGALADQWLELGPVTRTSSRCAMNVARFSSRCQKSYTSCGGLLTVVAEVSSMGVLLGGGGPARPAKPGGGGTSIGRTTDVRGFRSASVSGSACLPIPGQVLSRVQSGLRPETGSARIIRDEEAT